MLLAISSHLYFDETLPVACRLVVLCILGLCLQRCIIIDGLSYLVGSLIYFISFQFMPIGTNHLNIYWQFKVYDVDSTLSSIGCHFLCLSQITIVSLHLELIACSKTVVTLHCNEEMFLKCYVNIFLHIFCYLINGGIHLKPLKFDRIWTHLSCHNFFPLSSVQILLSTLELCLPQIRKCHFWMALACLDVSSKKRCL